MKKLISLVVFVSIFLSAAAFNSLHAEGVIVRPAVRVPIIVPAFPVRGYVWAGGYRGWTRRVYHPMWVPGYRVRPIYYRPVVRMRVW
jgi:hypothetical protein